MARKTVGMHGLFVGHSNIYSVVNSIVKNICTYIYIHIYHISIYIYIIYIFTSYLIFKCGFGEDVSGKPFK